MQTYIDLNTLIKTSVLGMFFGTSSLLLIENLVSKLFGKDSTPILKFISKIFNNKNIKFCIIISYLFGFFSSIVYIIVAIKLNSNYILTTLILGLANGLLIAFINQALLANKEIGSFNRKQNKGLETIILIISHLIFGLMVGLILSVYEIL